MLYYYLTNIFLYQLLKIGRNIPIWSTWFKNQFISCYKIVQKCSMNYWWYLTIVWKPNISVLSNKSCVENFFTASFYNRHIYLLTLYYAQVTTSWLFHTKVKWVSRHTECGLWNRGWWGKFPSKGLYWGSGKFPTLNFGPKFRTERWGPERHYVSFVRCAVPAFESDSSLKKTIRD